MIKKCIYFIPVNFLYFEDYKTIQAQKYYIMNYNFYIS